MLERPSTSSVARAGILAGIISGVVASGCETITVDQGSEYRVASGKSDSIMDSKLRNLEAEAEKYPKRHDIQYQIAVVHTQKSDYREAAKSLERAIRIAPEDAKYHYELGRVYMSMKELDLAEREFRAAVRLVPAGRYTGAHAALGEVLAERKDFRGALAEFEKCIQIEPENTQYYYVVGSLHDILGRREETIRHLEEYLSRGGTTYRKNATHILEKLGVIVENVPVPSPGTGSAQGVQKASSPPKAPLPANTIGE